ncbi:MAG: hypothetical protein ACRC3H_07105 [Lachnospiraceae bacterium]
MTDTERLRNLISESGLKYTYIAEKLGITRYALMNKINNISEFKSGEIAAMCDVLRVKSLTEKERIFFAK